MRFISRLERRFGRYAIYNLMLYIVIANGAVYIFDFMFSGVSLSDILCLDPARAFGGEVWRFVTFIFVPTYASSPIFAVMMLYFDYLIARILERVWGSFRLNLYYLAGVLATIAAALVSALLGSEYGARATSDSVNLTLLLACASLVPEMRITLFFFIPFKMRWLGAITWVFAAIRAITAPDVPSRLMILLPLANYLLFFGGNIPRAFRRRKQAYGRKQDFHINLRAAEVKKEYLHKCAVCGITELDAPDMTFRYCSKCNGDYEYCENHLHSHEHVQ
jgi:hypothetical protein